VKGFKDFILRGNLIELAVAFVIGAAFADVVKTFTAMFMDVLGKLGGTPNFSAWVPGGIHVGAFVTALIAFLVIATVIYFGVVLPYTKAKERFSPDEPPAATSEDLLAEIRDLLKGRQGQV